MEHRILVGHVLDQLAALPADHFHCVMTSPPYLGLRKYPVDPIPWPDGWVGHLGGEPDPHQFVRHLTDVFRAVRRVLHPSGVLFLNLGDSYARDAAKGQHQPGQTGPKQAATYDAGAGHAAAIPDLDAVGFKPKDLLGIPHRTAFALQADGWWLRNQIPWVKPNAMPYPALDRFVNAHEYLFMLTKAEHYHFDWYDVLEPYADARQGRDGSTQQRERNRGGQEDGFTKPNGIAPDTPGRRGRDVWEVPVRGSDWAYCAACATLYEASEHRQLAKVGKARQCACGRTDGWVAHYAAFPAELVVRALRAGCSSYGCCTACGAPWERQIDATGARPDNGVETGIAPENHSHGSRAKDASGRGGNVLASVPRQTTGFAPTCACHAMVEPCRVLDPFGGSGTTALVAEQMGLAATLIELSPQYAEVAAARIARHRRPPLFTPEVCN